MLSDIGEDAACFDDGQPRGDHTSECHEALLWVPCQLHDMLGHDPQCFTATRIIWPMFTVSGTKQLIEFGDTDGGKLGLSGVFSFAGVASSDLS